MTYLIQTRKKKYFRFFVSSPILFIIFLILLLCGFLFFSFFGSLVVSISSKVQGGLEKLSLVSYFKSKNSLFEENKILQEKNNELISKNADRNILFDENTNLKEIINKKDIKGSVMARVLARPGFSPYDVVSLGIGSNSGITKGAKVFYNSLAIGEVIEVEKNISRASLFSSNGKVFHALIGDKKIETEAKGLGGGAFEVLIPKGVIIKEGDPVLLPDKSLKIFGFVSSVFLDKADAFQKVYFSLPVNPYEISILEVEI